MSTYKRIAPKVFELKGATIDENTIKGTPSVYGNLDRGNDVIYPGAIGSKALKAFLKDGFLADAHDWTKMIGYPTVAKDDNGALYSEGVFHSTPDAQAIRTKCKERIDAGKSVGLSIGFGIGDEDTEYFKSGADLLAHAKGLGHDMSLFDQQSLKAHKGWCRAIKNIPELYEWSPVAVPMNPNAQAADVKSICGAKDLSLAPRSRKWDADAADKRLRGDADQPGDDFKHAHVVCDGPADEFTSYKLPFGDLIDGELKAVPKALFAIAEVLDGGRGGVEISDADRKKAKTLVAGYYKKMASEFDDDTIVVPWDKEDDDAEKAITALIQFKGELLGDIERSATCAAIDRVMWRLDSYIWSQIYNITAEDAAALADSLGPAFDEARDLCQTIVEAMLATLDFDELKTESTPYYYDYYGASPESQAALKFTQKAARLETDVAAFLTLASRRQEVRVKAGRTLSQATREKLQAIHEGLTEHCAKLKEMLEADPTAEDDDEDGTTDRIKSLRRQSLDMEAEAMLNLGGSYA